MGIFIKNMAMPKGDIPLVLIIASDGTVEEIDDSDEINATDATAVELPPHGDLVQLDDALDCFTEDDVAARKALHKVPIILEASI